jgi:hypothetical protein
MLATAAPGIKAADIAEADLIEGLKEAQTELEAELLQMNTEDDRGQQLIDRRNMRANLEKFIADLEAYHNKANYSPEAKIFMNGQLAWAYQTWQQFK